jgi:hypothetical protein
VRSLIIGILLFQEELDLLYYMLPTTLDSGFLYAAFFPSLVFYLYCLSVLVAKTTSMLVPAITWTSGHLRFRKPFQTIFSVAGGLLAGFWTLGSLLVEYP